MEVLHEEADPIVLTSSFSRIAIQPEKTIAWERDTDVRECRRCTKLFSFFTRKHHCRRCGRIFCSDCTDRYVTLPESGNDELVRVCIECYESTLQTLKEERARRAAARRNPNNINQAPENQSSTSDELEEYKALVKDQQEKISNLLERIRKKEGWQSLSDEELLARINDHEPNNSENEQQDQIQHLSRAGRSTSMSVNMTRGQHHLFNDDNATKQVSRSYTKKEPNPDYVLAMRLQEQEKPRNKKNSRANRAQENISSAKSSASHDDSLHKLVLEFDENLIGFVSDMGYKREQVILCLIKMHEDQQEITLEDVVQRLLTDNVSMVDNTNNNVTSITTTTSTSTTSTSKTDKSEEGEEDNENSKTRGIDFNLKLRLWELEREKEEQELHCRVLKKQMEEKDKQISFLTGGFGFETYTKVHGTQKQEDDEGGAECIICYENPPDFKASCGHQVMCKTCYKGLKRKQCPSCMKPIR